jgi:hypothetical protein
MIGRRSTASQGSVLQYFTGFSTWVHDSSIATLPLNFRSQAEIVKTGKPVDA